MIPSLNAERLGRSLALPVIRPLRRGGEDLGLDHGEPRVGERAVGRARELAGGVVLAGGEEQGGIAIDLLEPAIAQLAGEGDVLRIVLWSGGARLARLPGGSALTRRFGQPAFAGRVGFGVGAVDVPDPPAGDDRGLARRQALERPRLAAHDGDLAR